jgi:hypothetical protein
LWGNPFDSDEFPCGEKHEVKPTGLAPAIDVHPVVGLLFSDVLGGFVFAGGHRIGLRGDSIYAFSGEIGWRNKS